MKIILYTILLILINSCYQQTVKNDKGFDDEKNKTYVLKSSKDITLQNGIVFLNKKKFSGVFYDLNTNGKDTLSIEEYNAGLLDGISKKWYSNKQLKEERFYLKGEKSGKQIAYWGNGNKKFEFIAKNDSYVGEMKEWNFESQLIHIANFKNGQEDGTQKLWYDNGKIRANYFIINGKRYGLLGTKNCVNVSDSVFVIK